MGFFDSFSKKKENSSFGLADLPPPPLPNEKIGAGASLPVNGMPPPPKLESVQYPKFESDRILPMPPLPTSPEIPKMTLPSGAMPPPPSLGPASYSKIDSGEMKLTPPMPPAASIQTSIPSNAPVASLPALPKKQVISPIGQTDAGFQRGSAPSALPSMPRQNAFVSNVEYERLGTFSDTYEEVPFFSEPQVLVDLPSIEITDSENEQVIRPVVNTKKPLFIRTDCYSNVLSTIDTINDYISLSADTIYTLENLKKNTEVEHNNYKSAMEDIQRKLIYIDKILFEKGVV
jgi:hypothetical protein